MIAIKLQKINLSINRRCCFLTSELFLVHIQSFVYNSNPQKVRFFYGIEFVISQHKNHPMKSYKILLPLLLVLFSFQEITAQTYRFKADSFSVIEKNENGKWGEWTDFNNTPVVITLDGKKDRVVVNSKEIQLYNILAYGEKIVEKHQETIPMKCADNEGGLCTILIVTRKNEGNRKQFYINYEDVKIVYNVYVSE